MESRRDADASGGELKVCVSDARRQEIEGFGYEESTLFRGDDVRQEITWGGQSLDDLTGEVIRLDFYLRDADLFTFTVGSE